MNRHPFSNLFARYDLAGEDLAALVEDIKVNGLLSPITTYDGMVLDGWNRYQACRLSGVEPTYASLREGLDPWAFVTSSNFHRRHMTPAERVGVMLLKAQMDGCTKSYTPSVREIKKGTEVINNDHPSEVIKNDHPQPPSVRDIQKDLDISFGTAQKAKKIMEANDPTINEALAGNRIGLNRAVEITKLPKEERKAAIESPRPKPSPKTEPFLVETVGNPLEVPKPQPVPKTEASPDVAAIQARIAELEAENEELKDSLQEMASLMKETMEENDSIRRILDAEDLMAAYDKEVKRNIALARVTQERFNGIQNQNRALAKTAESWMRKFQKLEKKVKGTTEPDPEPAEENPYYDPSAPFDPMFDGPDPPELIP